MHPTPSQHTLPGEVSKVTCHLPGKRDLDSGALVLLPFSWKTRQEVYNCQAACYCQQDLWGSPHEEKEEHACSQRGRISWMFWPMRSQRQLPHHVPRAVPRLPLMPPAQGQYVFSSTVFCLCSQRLLDEDSVPVLG